MALALPHIAESLRIYVPCLQSCHFMSVPSSGKRRCHTAGEAAARSVAVAFTLMPSFVRALTQDLLEVYVST